LLPADTVTVLVVLLPGVTPAGVGTAITTWLTVILAVPLAPA
jgi:hypothetical protein